MFGLYKVENPANKANEMMSSARGSYAAMGQNRTTKENMPGPTLGGAVSAGLGGAVAGGQLAKMIGTSAATTPAAATGGVLAGEALGSAEAMAQAEALAGSIEAASVAGAAEAATATGATVAADAAAAGAGLGPWGLVAGGLLGLGSYLFG